MLHPGQGMTPLSGWRPSPMIIKLEIGIRRFWSAFQRQLLASIARPLSLVLKFPDLKNHLRKSSQITVILCASKSAFVRFKGLIRAKTSID